MKNKTRRQLSLPAACNSSYRNIAAFTIIVLSAPFAFGQTTYDVDLVTAGAQDGAGAGWNTSNSNFWNGTENVAWSNGLSDTANFGNGGTISNAAAGTVVVGTVNVGTIQFNSTSTTGYTFSSAGIITLGSGITTNQSTNTSTIASRISGSNGLAFVGVSGQIGAVTLSNNNNDYTGITTTSTGGRLVASAANALGSSAGASVSTLGSNYTQVNIGTSLVFNLASTNYNEAFVINGAGVGTAVGALRIAQNNVTLNSLIRLSGSASIVSNGSSNATFNGNLELDSNTLTVDNIGGISSFNGVISGATGNLTFTNAFTGAGNFYNLNNANTYGGTTTLNRTVGLGTDTSLGNSTILFAGGGIQSTDSTGRTISNTVGNFGAFANVTFGQTTTQTGALTFTNTTTSSFGNTSHTLTTNVNTSFANGFSSTGAGTITKAGAATLTLNGASTYTGNTVVSSGTLLANNTTGSATGSGTVSVSSGATLGGSGIITGATTINSGGTLNAGAAIGGVGTQTFSGGLDVKEGGIFAWDVTGSSADKVKISGGSLSNTGLGATFQVILGSGSFSDLFWDADRSWAVFVDSSDNVLTSGLDTIFASFSATGGLDASGNVASQGQFSFNGSSQTLNWTAVPEPTSALAGLLLGAGLLRRKRRAA